jgi:DNA topoisomerase-2
MNPTFNPRSLSSIINIEALEFALYNIENRHIPSIVDGLKPVQRFFLYSTLQNAKTAFNKVAAVAGRVSEYGYEHGESAASDAGQLMANTWNNHVPIIKGRGNFGSRMVQEMAAPRYTHCMVHDNFNLLFKDSNLAPIHSKDEHLPPAFYLPIIPFVLLNGVKGIATGYATHIIPHDPLDVTRCVVEYIEKGVITHEPKFKLPDFQGKLTVDEDNKLSIEGMYTFNGKTKLTITEIPYKYDREKYVEILDGLEEKGTIVRYEDNCGKDNFNFEVTLKRDFFLGQRADEHHEIFMKVFKLRQSATQNLTVLDWDRKLRNYKKSSDLIKDFVDYRTPFVQKRIDNEIEVCNYKLKLANAKTEFIGSVIDETIVLKGKTRAKAIKEIEIHENLKEFSDQLISMNMYHMTNDEIVKLKKQTTEIKKQLSYWNKTTVKKEYLKDATQVFVSLAEHQIKK